MKLSNDIKISIDKSVLCWLATSSSDSVPNVSPKEIFTFTEDDTIIVANIASPQTEKNIKFNENVCISFMDILVQKGFQLKGKASIITKYNSRFLKLESQLIKMTGGKFPFETIFEIEVLSSKPIIAPKYVLYPETTEQQQIESAKKAYLLNT